MGNAMSVQANTLTVLFSVNNTECPIIDNWPIVHSFRLSLQQRNVLMIEDLRE